jgi:hypothetical protein
VSRQLRQGVLDHRDVVARRVRAGITRTQQHRQRLTGPLGAVVHERAQRVKPEPPLERRASLLLIRVRRHQRRVQVHDQRLARVRVVVRRVDPGQLPHPSPRRRPGGVDRRQRGRGVRGQRGDRARDRRVRRHQPVQARLTAQHRDVRQAVPAQGQGHRQIQDDLGRVVHRQRLTPRRQRRRERHAQPARGDRLRQQHPTGLTHRPGTGGVDTKTRIETGTVAHLEGAP